MADGRPWEAIAGKAEEVLGDGHSTPPWVKAREWLLSPEWSSSHCLKRSRGKESESHSRRQSLSDLG